MVQSIREQPLARRPGRHFLQLPGPSNVPDRIQRAMHRPTIDHRGPDFQVLARRVLEGVQWVFKTTSRVFIYPSSATGAWEAAMCNTLSPGDRVLFFDHGFFGRKWAQVAERLGLSVELVPGDWREAVSDKRIGDLLMADTDHQIKAVMVVHNETATGVTTSMERVRRAMNTVSHPALLMADTVSSLGATDYRHDDWGVDVTVSGSQKAMMLPPGLSFVAASAKALSASRNALLPRSYWSWEDMIRFNDDGFFPYTPATTLLYGLDEALTMLREEGLDNVFARHARHASATRAAVEAWGLENQAVNPETYSNAATTVRMPGGHDADRLRKIILNRFDMSLGKGLGDLEGMAFRIGHLGDFNDLMLAGTIAGVEMGLSVAGVPHAPGGIQAAMEVLAAAPVGNPSL